MIALLNAEQFPTFDENGIKKEMISRKKGFGTECGTKLNDYQTQIKSTEWWRKIQHATYCNIVKIKLNDEWMFVFKCDDNRYMCCFFCCHGRIYTELCEYDDVFTWAEKNHLKAVSVWQSNKVRVNYAKWTKCVDCGLVYIWNCSLLLSEYAQNIYSVLCSYRIKPMVIESNHTLFSFKPKQTKNKIENI